MAGKFSEMGSEAQSNRPTTPFVGTRPTEEARSKETLNDKPIDADVAKAGAGGVLCAGIGAFGMPVELVDAASPILFRDNFNRSASAGNWETVTGIWTVQNGKLTGRPGEAGNGFSYLTSNQSFAGPIAVEVRYEQTPDANGEIIFNSTGYLANEYYASIWSKETGPFANRWAVQTYKNGVIGALIPPDATDVADGTLPSPFPIPTRGHFSVRRVGNTISLYVNWRQIGSVTDSDPLPAQGRVGLLVTGNVNGTTTFDNFVVRSVRR